MRFEGSTFCNLFLKLVCLYPQYFCSNDAQQINLVQSED
uniref:Uncharacterized protein n=1 Tax=Arundo donax TaxID=35708 RepID=A0A0A9AM76_ARUDO